MMLAPRRSPIAKRSYLDKGPTKESVERRTLVRDKLFSDDSQEGTFALNDEVPPPPSPRRRESKAERLGRSLSPSQLRKRLTGGRTRENRRGTSNSPQVALRKNIVSDNHNSYSHSCNYNHSSKNNQASEYPPSEPLSPKQVSRLVHPGRSKPTRSSSCNSQSPKQVSRQVHPGRSNPTRSSSCNSQSSKATSLSPKKFVKQLQLGRSKSTGKSRTSGLLDEMQTSYKDKLDQQSQDSRDTDTTSSQSQPDEDKMLERVARRVIERRGKSAKSRTSEDELELMRQALKRRQELENENDSEDGNGDGIGGLWSRGLRALERVYDDINTS